MRDKSSFPPGPWHVSGAGPKVRSIVAAGRTIAHVVFQAKREKECEATARLVAAAPDIYEALNCLDQAIIRWGLDTTDRLVCEDHESENDEQRADSSLKLFEAVERGRAAIAKVEGK